MNSIKRNIETQFEQEEELVVEQETVLEEDLQYSEKKTAFWVRIFSQDYSMILQYMPFLLFLFMLGLVYVYNGHYANKVFRNINGLVQECNDLEYRDKILKSEWYNKTQSSKIAERLSSSGFKELDAPPYSFKIVYKINEKN